MEVRFKHISLLLVPSEDVVSTDTTTVTLLSNIPLVMFKHVSENVGVNS